MKKEYFNYFFMSIAFLLAGCTGGFEGDLSELGKVNLIAPANSEKCEGSVVNGKVDVDFIWTSDGEDFEEYKLEITNTSTGENFFNEETATHSIQVSLIAGSKYSWKVIGTSVSGANIESENTFTTVTPGIPSISYPPFPADITFEKQDSENVLISYEAIDLNNDSLTYDVFVDVVSPPQNLLQTNTASSQLLVSMDEGIKYYVKIITKDNTGNYSESFGAYTP